MTAVFCTIATASHAAQALTCLDSVRAFHPDAHCVLLTVGRQPPAPDGVQLLPLEHCVPAEILARMRTRYSASELCFAVKPYLIAYLLDAGAGQVHYLDADCCAYASLAPLVEQLSSADVLLTPHALTPIPDDGRTPAPLTVLRGGAFNAGYLGVRNTAGGLRFARWLGEMTAQFAHNAPDLGMCGDQRWLDLVPALFPGHAICRAPGANVAYWNLHERALARTGARFTVNGEPLLFFHFSGWRAARPEQLSIHQNRHRTRDNPALEALLADYAARLPQRAKPSWWKLGLPERG